MRHPDLWALPGPHRFLKDVIDRLYRGRCITIRDAHGAGGVLDALGALIGQDGFVRLQVIDLRSPAVKLLAAINEALMTDVPSLAGLAVHEDTRNTALLLHLADAAHSADIQTFVRAGRLRPAGDTAVVVAACDIPLDGLCDEHWDALDAIGLVGPLDGMAFAAAHLTEADSLPTRIKAAVAVEVGAWDLNLTERLLDLPIKEAVRPDLCPDRWTDADTDNWTASQHLDGWGGEITRHPVWLVRNDLSSLRKRVWRGQLGVLFPWIEERRREVIGRYRSFLRPTEKTMAEVEMFDWGHIAFQLKSGAKGCPNAVIAARDIRNELAHGRPVSWPIMHQCLEEFRAWVGS